MNLYLIRHGETAWSLSGQHTGRTDIPLTPQGEQDARTLAQALRAVKFSRVFTSPRQRARRTCELVGLDGVAEIEPDLVEWDYGDYEGQRSEEIRKRRPDWNLFRVGCPRGESPAGVSGRADRLIAQFRTLKGNVAIFSHGHLGRTFAPGLFASAHVRSRSDVMLVMNVETPFTGVADGDAGVQRASTRSSSACNSE